VGSTNGVIDVSARSAHDTQATIAEAERPAGAISRPNVFVRIPATLEGLDVITAAIAREINHAHRRAGFTADRTVRLDAPHLRRVDGLPDRSVGGRIRAAHRGSAGRRDGLARRLTRRAPRGVDRSRRRPSDP
jgi:hypothetical protein